MSTDPNHVAILDTTLRDGEQSPGFSMSSSDKLAVARVLRDLKVDVLEAGFAAASPGDAEAVRLIASEIEGPLICSLARLTEKDIEDAARALEPAQRKRLHVLIPTSPIHRAAKMKMSKAEILQRISRYVAHARSACENIEFSTEDALRTERPYLVETLHAAIEAGATTVNLPDTVGYATPEETYDLFVYLRANVPGAERVIFSTHCHDDLGLAVANSLAAVRGGARQIECTINGIAERAGMAPLEEVVMALDTRRNHYVVTTQIDTRHLYRASQTVAHVTGCALPRNKAIVGRNAFAHESGIHQQGVLADRRTYEIIDPASVGAPPRGIVLGKHSGRAAVAARLEALKLKLDTVQLDALFARFKQFADTRKEVGDADLIRLAAEFGVTSTQSVRSGASALPE